MIVYPLKTIRRLTNILQIKFICNSFYCFVWVKTSSRFIVHGKWQQNDVKTKTSCFTDDCQIPVLPSSFKQNGDEQRAVK